ncbi:uncharacterized protein N0V89_012111 [Didymosphaeria variabile]|uniref:Uncharacterized protein n=1 Tax=Didymosphaeria variabile TaxID=1932322 RepID=A0A9W9C530_9PLEO|nr:uncharacterized protein N0V89_012111 [Didymosphaeria variabile]KAJ4344371.1 hypothetical protein N0V89_012111 [Didymosphaeria variabile]
MDKRTDEERFILLLRMLDFTGVEVDFETLSRQWYGDESLSRALREQFRHICEQYGKIAHSPEMPALPANLTAFMDAMLAEPSQGNTEQAVGVAAGDALSLSTFHDSPLEDTAQETSARWLSDFQHDLQQYVRQHESDLLAASADSESVETKSQDDSSLSKVEGRQRGRSATPNPRKGSASTHAGSSKIVSPDIPSHGPSSASRGDHGSPSASSSLCKKGLPAGQPTEPIPEFAVWAGSVRHVFDDEGTAELFRRQQEDREEQVRTRLEDEQEETRKLKEEKKLMERIRKIKNQRRMW